MSVEIVALGWAITLMAYTLLVFYIDARLKDIRNEIMDELKKIERSANKDE